MPEFELFSCAELLPNEVRQVAIAGRAPIAVYNLGGEFFATDDTCTHGEASLAEGDIDGGEIVCPFHRGAFDIRTGAATMAPCDKPLRTYPLRVEQGTLYIQIAP